MKQTQLTVSGFSRSVLFGLAAVAALFIVGCSQPQEGSEPAPQSVESGGISDDSDVEVQDDSTSDGSSTREGDSSSR